MASYSWTKLFRVERTDALTEFVELPGDGLNGHFAEILDRLHQAEVQHSVLNTGVHPNSGSRR